MFHSVGAGDVLQHVQQVGLRVEPVQFDGFDQGVPDGTGVGSFAGVGKQPVFPL